jgi:outer membrane protein assembly factor BamA
LNLSIDIDEDRQFTVNRINFNGNTTTRDEVIRREILIKERASIQFVALGALSRAAQSTGLF